MSDLISRQAAKEAIRDKFKDLPIRCEINEVLNGLPSVQPEQRWIPVSVDLPASYKDVLVAYRDGTDRPGEKLNVTKAWRWDGDSRWGTDHLESISRDYEVIYWMPLPEAPEIPEDQK